MIKIIIFVPHDKPETGGGTLVYSKALENLFKDSPNIRIYESALLPHKSIMGLKYNTVELLNYLKQEKPDIIHINGYTSLLVAQLVPLAKKLNIKTVYTAHWHPFYTMRKSWIKEMYFNIFNRPYLKDIDAIVAINNEDYRFFNKYSSKVHIIPHWIRSEIKDLPSVKKIDNQILFVGSLAHPNKGFEYLKNLPEGKYRIICVGRKGDASLRSDMILQSYISNEELTKLYFQSSLLIIPSKYEAFSYVALEALSAGTPVVMSEGVRIADHLKNFEGIRIFNLDSPKEFTIAVESMIGKEFSTETVLKKFSAGNAIKRYSALYKGIVIG